jgi:hypothetical protein
MISYDADFSAWVTEQAALLRRLARGERVNSADLDWHDIAEELEAVGSSERRELRGRMVRLLQHLLKWHYQPEHRSRSWRSTIRTERREIEELLEASPSLRPTLDAVVARAYRQAREDAMEETGLLNLPDASPFDAAQALTGPLPD